MTRIKIPRQPKTAAGEFLRRRRAKAGSARDFGARLQSRNVPFGTSGDYSWRIVSKVL